jgi:hypothetical protein
MLKNAKKVSLGLLTAILISSSSISPVFAASHNGQASKSNNTSNVNQGSSSKTNSKSHSFGLINGPASYEHKTEQVNLDQDQLWELKSKAEDANDENTESNYVSLASYILGFVNGDAGQITSTISSMLVSRLDAFETLDYAFTEYKFLDINPDCDSVPTMIPLERFYDGGESMSDWYPCKHPYEAD